MACFLVPALEAAAVTAVRKHTQRKEEQRAALAEPVPLTRAGETLPWSRRLSWLERLLWGGSLLLGFEHLWHGEVVPWFPFLTAAAGPGGLGEIFSEMATVGVTMAALVTGLWGIANALVTTKALAPGGKQRAV